MLYSTVFVYMYYSVQHMLAMRGGEWVDNANVLEISDTYVKRDALSARAQLPWLVKIKNEY